MVEGLDARSLSSHSLLFPFINALEDKTSDVVTSLNEIDGWNALVGILLT